MSADLRSTIQQPWPGRPLRVLQVCASLHNGGPERWLVDVCQAGPAENLSMDIAVLWDANGLFAQKARERKIPIYQCAGGANPFKFVGALRRLIRERGPYDAIHCHIHAFSAFGVLAARLEGVPARVVHSHNVVKDSTKSLFRRGYIVLARALLRLFATAGLAPSAASLEDLFGPNWRADPRWSVLPCGIDLTPFSAPIETASSRAELGIPDDALVLGSVGHLSPLKNSDFLVDVLASVLRVRADAYLLMIGEGPLREALLSKAQKGGYGDRLVLPGRRPDVPALMRNVMDVFVFPSPPPPLGNEALPIAVVEAQAAGLPTVISDGVTEEAILVPELVLQIPADAGPEKWASAVIQQARLCDSVVARGALGRIERSNHNCAVSMKVLATLYRNVGVSSQAAILEHGQATD